MTLVATLTTALLPTAAPERIAVLDLESTGVSQARYASSLLANGSPTLSLPTTGTGANYAVLSRTASQPMTADGSGRLLSATLQSLGIDLGHWQGRGSGGAATFYRLGGELEVPK